jgi:hypothetical protein
MNRFHSCAVIVKFLVFAACVGGLSNSTTACLRRYSEAENAARHKEIKARRGMDYMMELESESGESPSDEMLAELRLAAENGDYRAKSDYAVALIRHGDVAPAVEILKAIEAEKPGEYVIASNLGTAYELAGDDQHALEWITTGLRRNPESHDSSEWLHVKILEAKLAMAKDPAWLNSHSILGLDFATADTPTTPKQTVTDLDGHAKTLADVRSALEYQLRERLSLVEFPDAVVANLLFDLGNLLMLDKTSDLAYWVYQAADRYAKGGEPLIHRRLVASRPANWGVGDIWPLLSIGLLGLIIVAAVGFYLRQHFRQYTPLET